MRFINFISIIFITALMPGVLMAQANLPEFSAEDPLLYKKDQHSIHSANLKKIQFTGEIGFFAVLHKDGSRRIGVVNKQGKVLVPPRYRNVSILTSEIIALQKEDGAYEFFYKDNGFIAPERCDTFQYIHPVLLWGSNYRWGAVIPDKKRKVKTIPARYKKMEIQLNMIKALHFPVWIRSTSETDLPYLYDSIAFISDSVFIYERSGFKGWAIDNGTELTPALYQEVKPWGKNFFEVTIHHKRGLADHTGNIILKPLYDSLVHVSGFYIKAYIKEHGWKFYDEKGQALIDSSGKEAGSVKNPSYPELLQNRNNFQKDSSMNLTSFSALRLTSLSKIASNKLLFLARGEKYYGVFGSNADTILPLKYDSIGYSSEDSVFIIFEGKNIGIADQYGIFLTAPHNRFERVYPFREGRAMFQKAGKLGFIDARGNVRVAPQYKEARDYVEGAAAVLLNGKWGFIDKDENIVVQPLYHEVKDFRNGLARCRSGKQWFFVNKNGSRVSSLFYDAIEEEPGNKWFLIKSGKLGLADSLGREQLAPRYEYIKDVQNNQAIVKKSGKWGVVDYKENFIIPITYDAIVHNPWKHLFLLMNKGREELIQIGNEK